jgi:hypothetical protein
MLPFGSTILLMIMGARDTMRNANSLEEGV